MRPLAPDPDPRKRVLMFSVRKEFTMGWKQGFPLLDKKKTRESGTHVPRRKTTSQTHVGGSIHDHKRDQSLQRNTVTNICILRRCVFSRKKKGKCATEVLNKGAFLTVGATQPKETRDSEQCDLLRRPTVQPHPFLPVILLETEELFISEHDASHVNTWATFRQHPSLPKFSNVEEGARKRFCVSSG